MTLATQDHCPQQRRRETHYDGREMLCFAERPDTLVSMFADLVRRFPERPAIVEDGAISYRELDRLVCAVAAGLAARGIGAGDRVALYLGNCWEFLAVTLACFRLGTIVVPIGTRQRRAELEFLLNDTGARLIVVEIDLMELLPARHETPKIEEIYSIRGDVAGAKRFEELVRRDLPAPPAFAAKEEDTAVLLYTSGTTGKPKGAMLTHLGVIHSALTFAYAFDLTHEDRGLVAVPLSHVTGLVGVSFATMIVGGAIVLMRPAYKTPDFLALAAREKITFSILVPTIYTLCSMHPDLGSYDLSAWRIGSFGGAPMPVATIEALAQKLPHLALRNAYGATETTSPTTVMPADCWRDHLDSIGQVVACGAIKVMDADGAEAPRGEIGELWISGPMVVPGYWNRPDANASEFVDGFWRSGDLCSIDAQGFVRIYDRKKDMINRGGFKIFSAEVENTVAGIPGVLECAIVGTPDPVLGERVHAIVVVEPDTKLTPALVRAYCAERMSDYKTPETIDLRVAPLPRNANGKVMKPQLRAEAIAARE